MYYAAVLLSLVLEFIAGGALGGLRGPEGTHIREYLRTIREQLHEEHAEAVEHVVFRGEHHGFLFAGKVEGGIEHRLGIVAVGPVIGPLPLALEAGNDGVVAYHLLLEFLGEIGVALYEILYDAVHLYGKFPLLALFLVGKPYAALLAQELHGFGIVVAALLAVLECPRQRLFIGFVVVYALLHAAEYLYLIDGFDAQAEVFLHELLVYDGAAYAHAHGAYL